MLISEVAAQENPPIPIEVEVRTAQILNFGQFSCRLNWRYSGNWIQMEKEHAYRRCVFALEMNLPQRIFDVFANPGTLIQVRNYHD